MKDLRRARRVGIRVICFAVILRLWTAGVPKTLLSLLSQWNMPDFFVDSETGQPVRFSSSSEVFFPDFVETPPPSLPEATEAPLPSFSGEEAVEITYTSTKTPDISALLSQPLTWDLRGQGPTVLILHTHATESYTQAGEAYVESASWRTLDGEYNMLSIGRRVAQILAQNGITALQDQQLHDYPSYNGSYAHARKAIQIWLEKYPSIQLVLDLHRDAAGTDSSQMRTLCYVNEQASAQLMIVLGTNHDHYEKNLSLGLKLQSQLQRQNENIVRPLQLRASRFNQDLTPGALLIEVGAAGNTHAEAMTAAEELAKAIVTLARGTQ